MEFKRRAIMFTYLLHVIPRKKVYLQKTSEKFIVVGKLEVIVEKILLFKEVSLIGKYHYAILLFSILKVKLR